MSLLKRHIGRRRHAGRRRHTGRRVVGVIVGASLLVLGLEAPAFALTPNVTSFTPSSGPAGCVVQITGSNFTNPIVTGVAGVQFGGVNAVNYVVKSDTEIWAMAPGPGFITVTNASGTGSSTTQFTAATPGGCAPTADSFTPTCGPPGTHVTVTGTNLMGTSTVGAAVFFSLIPPGVLAPETAPPTPPTLTERTVVVPGAAADGPIGVFTLVDIGLSATTFDVGTCITQFAPTSGDIGTPVTITGVGFDNVTQVQFFNGIPAVFTLVSDTDTVDTITTTVPFGAATGPITLFTVDAANGTSVSTASDFTVGPGGDRHERRVRLRLRAHLVAKGRVRVPDGFIECAQNVPVKIQRKRSGGWRTVRVTTTSVTGSFKKRLPDRPGVYRAVARKITLPVGDVCLKDVSNRVRHLH